MNSKEKTEFYRQKLLEWKKFRESLVPYFHQNPEATIRGKDIRFWFGESNAQISKIENAIKKIERQQIAINFLPFAMAFFAVIALFSFRAEITGFVTRTETPEGYSYLETLNISYTESNQYQWVPEQKGTISSVKLSGMVSGEGTARAYLSAENMTYRVFDNEATENEGQANTTPAAENAKKADIIENENLTAKLAYNSGTLFDSDDDGIENENSVVDFSISESFFKFNGSVNVNRSVNISKDNMCTRWEIENLETRESSFECYGSERCCNFAGLIPAEQDWNATYNVFKGKNTAGNDNVIRAQLLYVGETIEDIYASGWLSLKAKFIPEKTLVFYEACIDTCRFSSNASHYFLIFELVNASIKIDDITYSIAEMKNVTETIANETNQTLDSCSCPVQGDWIVSNTSCTITNDCNLNGGNIYLDGEGTFSVDGAAISNIGMVIKSNSFVLAKKNGGRIIR